MRKILHFLTVCLVPLAFQAARADDVADTARAATRRNAATTVVANTSARQKSTATPATTTPAVSRTATTASTPKGTSTRERTTTSTATGGRASANVVNVESRSAITTTAPRPTSTVQSRTAATPSRAAASVQSRTATATRGTVSAPANGVSRAATTITRGAIPSRAATITSPTTARRATTATVSRSATTPADADARAAVMNKDYKKCREVYYSCMDEFCANKDAQLKRCACSSRIHEFDSVKKRLDNVEEKMLDFSQRLLTVNMDKEDADALFNATEGELAFQQKDTSDSKKILDEIAKKLQTGTTDSRTEQNLGALSWSLNTDAAFDNIDSMLGASTTVKEGTALYNAALPVCREMAMEVCDEDGLALAQSGYLMTIEQDCTTVAKSYETQTEQAREKVRESSALLDMSRLDIHQKRNSDDILTCKKKMLDMLSNSTVCGENLGKCLDTTGRYIDPSTGEAFLTENLVDLAGLITRPSGDEKWTTAPGNDKFVTYLNSKKKYLEPAMENCQDIADSVWDAFVEDALAQIKLAQEGKLEDMRQSCTALTTKCLSDTAKSLADFDARALSIFGVHADKTVKEMCSEVQTACTALLNQTGDTSWSGGMSDIATDTTYDTLLRTCREVGKNCIVQACKSISGNFGLCENIQTSINRKSIINRTACWGEVQECISAAGDDAIADIMVRLGKPSEASPSRAVPANSFYAELYPGITEIITEKATACGLEQTCIYDICQLDGKCTGPQDGGRDCQICRLTERIWGNCESDPLLLQDDKDSHNRILDTRGETLLSWFAINTGTAQMAQSCRDTTCGYGFYPEYDDNGNVTCSDASKFSKGEKKNCGEGVNNKIIVFESPELENCCASGQVDSNGNCCPGDRIDYAVTTIRASKDKAHFGYVPSAPVTTICLPSTAKFVLAGKEMGEPAYNANGQMALVCDGTITGEDTTDPKFPGGKQVKCSGKFIWVDLKSLHYFTPKYDGQSDSSPVPINFYNSGPDSANVCTWSPASKSWTGQCIESGTPQRWQIGSIGN